jgi:hypothetical protein
VDDPAFSLWEHGGTVLGEGQFGSERWELVFFSESEAPPKNPEDHSGPGLISLRYGPADGSHGGGACGHGPPVGLSGRFVEMSGTYDRSSPVTWVFGEVAPEFDSVTVSSAHDESVDAVVVECLDRFPFNYYVALLPERPTQVNARGKGVEPYTQKASGWDPPLAYGEVEEKVRKVRERRSGMSNSQSQECL